MIPSDAELARLVRVERFVAGGTGGQVLAWEEVSEELREFAREQWRAGKLICPSCHEPANAHRSDCDLSTWEERISRRAAERRQARAVIEEAEDVRRREDERRAAQLAGLAVEHFEGTCDVCGEPISHDWLSTDGTIDVGVTDDGRVYTWIRHYAVAPQGANPDCAVFSSRAYAPRPPDA